MFDQNQKTYQEPKKFKTSKKIVLKKYHEIGMNYEAPKENLENATWVDKKCPFTGDVSIRGKILKGEVKSTKMERTIVVRMNYLKYIKKYKRYEKRHSNIMAHCSPVFFVKEGDIVIIGECRPLAKNVHFNVIKIERKGNGKFTNK